MAGFVGVTRLLNHKVLHNEGQDWSGGTRNVSQSPEFSSLQAGREVVSLSK